MFGDFAALGFKRFRWLSFAPLQPCSDGHVGSVQKVDEVERPGSRHEVFDTGDKLDSSY